MSKLLVSVAAAALVLIVSGAPALAQGKGKSTLSSKTLVSKSIPSLGQKSSLVPGSGVRTLAGSNGIPGTGNSILGTGNRILGTGSSFFAPPSNRFFFNNFFFNRFFFFTPNFFFGFGRPFIF